MRLVLQRVRRATVRVDETTIGAIGAGAVVLVGVARGDTPELADRMADKLIGLRYFEDDAGMTNRPIDPDAEAFLVVSQFTLLADVRHGRRPGFSRAESPELAEALVERFASSLRAAGYGVATGRFGASMEVELVNDGPFTLLLDSDRDLAR